MPLPLLEPEGLQAPHFCVRGPQMDRPVEINTGMVSSYMNNNSPYLTTCETSQLDKERFHLITTILSCFQDDSHSPFPQRRDYTKANPGAVNDSPDPTNLKTVLHHLTTLMLSSPKALITVLHCPPENSGEETVLLVARQEEGSRIPTIDLYDEKNSRRTAAIPAYNPAVLGNGPNPVLGICRKLLDNRKIRFDLYLSTLLAFIRSSNSTNLTADAVASAKIGSIFWVLFYCIGEIDVDFEVGIKPLSSMLEKPGSSPLSQRDFQYSKQLATGNFKRLIEHPRLGHFEKYPNLYQAAKNYTPIYTSDTAQEYHNLLLTSILVAKKSITDILEIRAKRPGSPTDHDMFKSLWRVILSLSRLSCLIEHPVLLQHLQNLYQSVKVDTGATRDKGKYSNTLKERGEWATDCLHRLRSGLSYFRSMGILNYKTPKTILSRISATLVQFPPSKKNSFLWATTLSTICDKPKDAWQIQCFLGELSKNNPKFTPLRNTTLRHPPAHIMGALLGLSVSSKVFATILTRTIKR
ncbi:hypothetical protein L873DRAFT_1791291 [Choiromyces venosus 120613-1]|uniref:Uncharacterized protein n=1 Tax=Choiromyces venosus 120613-1 TaxID=1336337 RepID=A0A3N4JKS2_9PEZI|nr:hypothetical protein L873DRAFT_1791291 [Choiromyces venosus 120613-1]